MTVVFSGPPVPSRVECASCFKEVLTGRERAVLWGDRGWCLDCWFQGPNVFGHPVQQVPLCA
jgi:hypothetical protein